MTDATCRPVATPLTVWERERQGDRMTRSLSSPVRRFVFEFSERLPPSRSGC